MQYECACLHSRSLSAELPAAPPQLSVHMAEVLTQKQCREPVRKEDLRDSQSSGNSLYVVFTVRLF